MHVKLQLGLRLSDNQSLIDCLNPFGLLENLARTKKLAIVISLTKSVFVYLVGILIKSLIGIVQLGPRTKLKL